MARHLDNKCVKGLVGLQLLNSLFLGLCLLSMHDEGNCGEALLRPACIPIILWASRYLPPKWSQVTFAVYDNVSTDVVLLEVRVPFRMRC